jgi:hypothetical protein
MKQILMVLFSIAICAALVRAENLGKVSFMVGKVKVKAKQAADWKDARMNLAVAEGDQVATGKADRLELTLKDGSVIRIAEESDVTLDCPGAKTVSPVVQKGKLWGNIKKLSQRSYEFEVTTGTATAAIRGTVFRVDNNPKDSMSSVLVYDGKVEVGPGKQLQKTLEAAGQKPFERKEVSGPTEVPGPFEVSLMDWVAIVKGQRIDVKPDGKYNKFKFNEKQDAQDEWVKFNKERDLAQPVSKEGGKEGE